MSSSYSYSDDYDSDSSDANSNSVAIVYHHLIDAILADNLEHLREILSQVDISGNSVVTQDNVHNALYYATEVGSVRTCRILWEALSPYGKQKYFAKKGTRAARLIQLALDYDHLKIVRLFIGEFKWNINQMDYGGITPLFYAVPHGLEMVRYFMENGANVNQGGNYGPLFFATEVNDIEVCYLLLMKYHANPNLNRRPAEEEDYNHFVDLRNTDFAIRNGSIEVLNMLLECGAWVGHNNFVSIYGTSLNFLLSNQQKSRENKIDICHILLEYAKEDRNTATYMHDAFEFAIQQETGQILLEAGFDPRMSMFCAIRGENLSICQLLVNEYQVDPFFQQEVDENDDSDDETEDVEADMEEEAAMEAKEEEGDDDDENEDGVEAAARQPDTSLFEEEDDDDEQEQDDETENEQKQVAAASPFVAAARLVDTTILKYFLELWDEHFSSSGGGGKNGNDNYMIHVISCDPHVSLQAIQLVVQRHPDALVVHVVGHGFLPFQLAAIWDASLDVIFICYNIVLMPYIMLETPLLWDYHVHCQF